MSPSQVACAQTTVLSLQVTHELGGGAQVPTGGGAQRAGTAHGDRAYAQRLSTQLATIGAQAPSAQRSQRVASSGGHIETSVHARGAQDGARVTQRMSSQATVGHFVVPSPQAWQESTEGAQSAGSRHDPPLPHNEGSQMQRPATQDWIFTCSSSSKQQ